MQIGVQFAFKGECPQVAHREMLLQRKIRRNRGKADIAGPAPGSSQSRLTQSRPAPTIPMRLFSAPLLGQALGARLLLVG